MTAQAFEAGDFLNILLSFLGFTDSFSYKNVSYRKKKMCSIKHTFTINTGSRNYRNFVKNFSQPLGYESLKPPVDKSK